MKVIRNRAIVPDRWQRETAAPQAPVTQALPPGDLIVTLARWLEDREALLARGSRIGVQLAPDDDVDALVAGGLEPLALVEIAFGSFSEGRGYSQARLLRSRHGFVGDLRATGDLSRDRLAFMERCGFNEFALPEGRPLEDALAAFDEIGERYQPAADRGVTVAGRRGYRVRAPVAAA